MTPERVPLTLPLAGIGERAIATVVDAMILVLVLAMILTIYSGWGRGDLEADVRNASRNLVIVLVVCFVVGLIGYDIFFDLVFAGRTPGKRAARVRVVDRSGQSPPLLTSLLRNMLRLVDMLPIGYGVGAVVMFFTGTRRIGDLVAGTLVISERDRGVRAYDAVKAAALDVLVTAPAWSDADVAAAVDVVTRTVGLGKLPAEIPCKRVLQKLPAIAGAPTDVPARALLAAAVVSMAEANEGLAVRLRRLADAEDALRKALAGFEDHSLDADVVDAAVRQASSELLLATRRQTPARHLESLSLALLDLERRRRPPAGPLGPRLRRFLAVDVPQAVWSERANIARAAGVLSLALVLGFAIAFADADLARALVGDDLAVEIENGAAWTNKIETDHAYASTSIAIILNNIAVGLRVFVYGVAGAVGTLLGLVSNGLSIGAVFGYATRLGTQETLLRFIVAHGPLELSMICVSGGAGLCLGRAVLSPGRRSRLQALREEGGRGLRLMVFAMIGFAVVGGVEGFVSPGTHFPTALNATVGALLWLLFAAWVVGARPRMTTTKA
ncbi:MAG: stage II sporulation protein M [Deltaproteobacteria bacterium]|nr:stage II sporulation protein M [Deltaproteobacteria bacterium]